MDQPNNNFNIRKVLFNEVSLVVAVLAVAFGVFNFISSPVGGNTTDILLLKQEVEIIKSNHLVHIQDDINSISDVQEDNIDKLNEIDKKLEVLISKFE